MTQTGVQFQGTNVFQAGPFALCLHEFIFQLPSLQQKLVQLPYFPLHAVFLVFQQFYPGYLFPYLLEVFFALAFDVNRYAIDISNHQKDCQYNTDDTHLPFRLCLVFLQFQFLIKKIILGGQYGLLQGFPNDFILMADASLYAAIGFFPRTIHLMNLGFGIV